jgi:heptosyltransferase III
MAGETFKSVAVFRTGYLGDTVCAVPAFRLIRESFPAAEITFITEKAAEGKAYSGDVVAGLGIFNAIETYAPGSTTRAAWMLSRVLRKCRPDLLIILPQRIEDAGKLRLKRTFLRVTGGCEVWAESFSDEHNGVMMSEPHRLVALLQRFGLKGNKPAYSFPTADDARASVVGKLNAAQVNASEPFLIFCGGGKTAAQRWSIASYEHLFQRLRDTFDAPIVAIGSSAEQASYSAIHGVPNFHVLRPSLSFRELVELLRLGKCYIGNDTGPMHLAAAVGTPVAVLMSGRNPRGCWDPDVERRLVIRHEVPCEGCFLETCVEKQHACMTGITPEFALAQLVPFLGSFLRN